jgi:N-acetylneuraminic acid mutarotase
VSSVEILDFITGSWRQGPELPIQTCDGVMVHIPSGGVVLIGGASTDIYMLTDARSQWTKLAQKVSERRYFPVAFLIPDNLTSCT